MAFPADETLKQLVKKAIKETTTVSCMEGRVASGDQFIADHDKKQWIRDTFHADVTEMEGAAIAHTCYINKTPFVIIRAISDKADGSDVREYFEVEREAAHNCAQVVEQVLRSVQNN